MSYEYEKENKYVFTDKGQIHFLHIRDLAHKLLKQSGAVREDKLLVLAPGVGAASNWEMLACIDRLVEIGEIKEVSAAGSEHGRILVLKSE